MNNTKEINKDIIRSTFWLAIGILALFIGHILNYQVSIMSGIAIGLIPVGIGEILIYTYIKNNKDSRLTRNYELEKDERNTFINTKSGYTAFWISYWYIVIFTLLAKNLDLTLQNFLILTLFLMPFIYFALLYVNHKKY